jgi:CheY-like chemotaxis protein
MEPPQPGTVLVVDDSPLQRRQLSDMLQLLGYTHVEEASTGQAALDRLARPQGECPALVCLDLTLPDISGFDVCEFIRSSPELKDLPVLMISARGQTLDRAQAEEAGVSAYLIKPVTVDALRLQVERLLTARPRKEASSP